MFVTVVHTDESYGRLSIVLTVGTAMAGVLLMFIVVVGVAIFVRRRRILAGHCHMLPIILIVRFRSISVVARLG